jgi:hypothetical protein
MAIALYMHTNEQVVWSKVYQTKKEVTHWQI